ncbi:hypothetical protein KTD31_00405 [Burkholderia multivorans]|uniref:hypothetical protein n=1 Tax=Burkholderia multivorans TaxID=87883 RepID=UPI001C228ADF|nr:hypothetical protein [Burkholderia multivorans]MBU9199860.1 hypothetical protein [Burkholderia multivorans]MDN8079021.1 hypothetical protein [Burkholderia multivorans]
MIENKGTHVIRERGRHGSGIYRCTLANANKLVEMCLQYDSPWLAKLVDELDAEKRKVLPVSWLVPVFTEVRDNEAEPRRFRAVLFGPGPRLRDDADMRPLASVEPQMQDELILACYKAKVQLEALRRDSQLEVEKVTHLFDTLTFLKPARDRIVEGVRFIDDSAYRGWELLKTIRANKWKPDAKEENIIANHYCEFLSTWSRSEYVVDRLEDL